MPTFADLGLAEPICRALDPDAFPAPTEIQVRVVPSFLKGRDLLALAQRGAGKTAAWVLALLQRLHDPASPAEARMPRALVLTHDREVAETIGLDLENHGRFVPIRSFVAAEGAGWNHQLQELRTSIEVLVATPRRLLELHRQRAVALRAVEFVVFDAADMMLDQEIQFDCDRILAELPTARQTAMFTSTTPPALRTFATNWLQRPVGIKGASPAPVAAPEQADIPSISDDITADPPEPIELPDWLDKADPADLACDLPQWLDESAQPTERAGPAAPEPKPDPPSDPEVDQLIEDALAEDPAATSGDRPGARQKAAAKAAVKKALAKKAPGKAGPAKKATRTNKKRD